MRGESPESLPRPSYSKIQGLAAALRSNLMNLALCVDYTSGRLVAPHRLLEKGYGALLYRTMELTDNCLLSRKRDNSDYLLTSIKN